MRLLMTIIALAFPLFAAANDADTLKNAETIAKQRLETFDALDFDVFSNQKWDQIKLSHAQNVKVHWPDGRVTVGLEKHIEDLKAMFVSMPDLQISEHPVRIVGTNAGKSTRAEHPKAIENLDLKKVEWTSVMGIMTGTFTEPMPIGDGKFIPPTGNKIHVNMVTVGHWTKDGVMDEEFLFYDNATFSKQLGIK